MKGAQLARADAARLAIFLDFDGCLVDLAPRPQDVVVPTRLGPLLHCLWRRSGGALALISGRPVSEIREFFPGLSVPICGSHGAERAVSGRRVARIAVDQTALDAAAARAEVLFEGTPGLLLERKPVGLGLHYRAAPSEAQRIERIAEELLSSLPGFHAHHGKMVVELRLDGIGKGHALRDLMAHAPFRGRVPVMFGDDATDEPAFGTSHRFGGTSVKVGAGETQARHRLASPNHVHRLLASWAARETSR